MKTKKHSALILLMCGLIISSGCATMSKTMSGGLMGTGAGAALGAGVGALIGKGKGAAIGAGIGAAVGGTAGALIGHRMDKQKAELEKIQGAQVEEVTDANNLKGIKVTFADGILFASGKSELNQSSKTALTDFAKSLASSAETDVTIYGHTDNTGGRDYNLRLSTQRAQAVGNFLTQQGLSSKRFTTKGLAFDSPAADNATVEGRAKNRRVEIYITANETMIKQAEAGALK